MPLERIGRYQQSQRTDGRPDSVITQECSPGHATASQPTDAPGVQQIAPISLRSIVIRGAPASSRSVSESAQSRVPHPPSVAGEASASVAAAPIAPSSMAASVVDGVDGVDAAVLHAKSKTTKERCPSLRICLVLSMIGTQRENAVATRQSQLQRKTAGFEKPVIHSYCPGHVIASQPAPHRAVPGGSSGRPYRPHPASLASQIATVPASAVKQIFPTFVRSIVLRGKPASSRSSAASVQSRASARASVVAASESPPASPASAVEEMEGDGDVDVVDESHAARSATSTSPMIFPIMRIAFMGQNSEKDCRKAQ